MIATTIINSTRVKPALFLRPALVIFFSCCVLRAPTAPPRRAENAAVVPRAGAAASDPHRPQGNAQRAAISLGNAQRAGWLKRATANILAAQNWRLANKRPDKSGLRTAVMSGRRGPCGFAWFAGRGTICRLRPVRSERVPGSTSGARRHGIREKPRGSESTCISVAGSGPRAGRKQSVRLPESTSPGPPTRPGGTVGTGRTSGGPGATGGRGGTGGTGGLPALPAVRARAAAPSIGAAHGHSRHCRPGRLP